MANRYRLARRTSGKPLKLLHELGQGNADGSAELPELNQVEASFSPLALAHVGLGLIQPAGDFDLRQARSLAFFAQQLSQAIVVTGEQGFFHRRRLSEVDPHDIVQLRIVLKGLFHPGQPFFFQTRSETMSNGSHPHPKKSKAAAKQAAKLAGNGKQLDSRSRIVAKS